MSRSNALLSGIALGLILATVPAAKPARADFAVYSNITNFSSAAFPTAGATLVAGDTITQLTADDITPIAGAAGESVDSFTFSVANFNSTDVSARALVRFYGGDGASGGPGTLLGGFNFNPITFTAGSVGLFTFAPGTALFTLPSGTFWAAIAFDNNSGATGATAAQLNNLGQGLFDPPTIGSSQDVFFQGDTVSNYTTSNPTGSFLFFGGSPVANFGWAFRTLAVAPEPASLALFGIGATLAGGLALRRRRVGRSA